MRYLLLLFFSLTTTVSLIRAQESPGSKGISLEDIWEKGTFSPAGVRGFIPMADGKSYCQLDKDDAGNTLVVRYEYASGNKIGVYIDGAAIAAANGLPNFRFSSFELSEDETKALIPTEISMIYRHSFSAKYLVWNKADNKLLRVSEDQVRYAQFNPQADKVAFVWENNLYIRDLVRNKTRRITKDGAENEIINGAVDWVYEEEFSMSSGFEWNVSGDKIAYYKFDERNVKQWNLTIYGSLYPELEKYKYPKAGEANSTVYVHVYDLKKRRDKRLELGSENDQYLPRIKWTKDPLKLSIQRMNRHQNHWELIMADAKTGKSTVVLEHRDDRYIDITDNLFFLDDKEHFIISRETDYWHLYMHKVDGPQVFQITKGTWDVEDVLGVDTKNQKLYFTSTEIHSTERHLFVCDIDGKNKKQLSSVSGWHGAAFSSDFSYYLHSVSSANTPPVFSIRKNTGEVLRVLEDNSELQNTMKEYRVSPVDFGEMKFDNADYSLNYYMIKPLKMEPGKKYPLLMFVYGGPGSQQVTNSWLYSNYLWHQMLANEHGYIIACVDNRGTGGKGAQFKKMTYLQLGKLEIEDQIKAAQYLGNLPYIDANRIGIWGWSYGGYMSSLGITRGHNTFKTAIAVAPVTNWRYYDNIYTERFMRTPKENGDNYDINSPLSHVDSIRGNYLIVHGTADDNVHFQNAVEMVNAMIVKNIAFDSEFYPNKNHGIYGGKTRLHLFRRMTGFVLDEL